MKTQITGNKKFYLDEKGKVLKVTTVFHKPSKTNKDFAAEVDVNNIMDRFLRTGQLSHVSNEQLVYQDNTNIPDLQSAIHQVKSAGKIWDNLSKKLKNKFKSPDELYDYLSDPKNTKEALELGIISEEKTTTIQTTMTTPPKTENTEPKTTNSKSE